MNFLRNYDLHFHESDYTSHFVCLLFNAEKHKICIAFVYNLVWMNPYGPICTQESNNYPEPNDMHA